MKPRHSIIASFLLSIFISAAAAQTYSIETIVNTMIAGRDTAKLFFMTHPADSSKSYSSKTRFGAWVPDNQAKVTVNGASLKVHPSGAVADMLQLEEGWNRFNFVVATERDTQDYDLHLYRIPALQVLPEKPVAISDTLMQPAADRIYYGTNELSVSFTGSAGGEATFQVRGLTHGRLPMKETSPGRYTGIYRIRETDACNEKKVIFRLAGKSGGKEKRKSAARIIVIPESQPKVAVTNAPNTLVYYGIGGEIFMDLPAGIEVAVKADFGSWCRVEVADGHSGFISKSDLDFPVPGELLDKAALTGIFSSEDSNWVYLSFNLSDKVPFDIQEHRDPERISLTLYRTYFRDEWTVYPENQNVLRYLDWEQVDDSVLCFDFALQNEQSWGFYGKYSGSKFILALRKPPVIEAARPFHNLTIALDAGHGGDHWGARGATGVLEKDINLVYMHYIAERLKNEGARVVITRPDDQTMSLKSRMDIAVAENAQLFLWLHNNSTGMLRHPDDVSGTSTYYTPLQGLDFARSIYPHLKGLGLAPEGLIHRSYYMTRQTFMPVVLVEGAFLSNPADEMFLMKDDNLRKLADAVIAGLRDQLIILAEGAR